MLNPILLIQSNMSGVETMIDTATTVATTVAEPEKLSILKLALQGGWIMIVLAQKFYLLC